jgi:hypothetical protein
MIPLGDLDGMALGLTDEPEDGIALDTTDGVLLTN